MLKAAQATLVYFRLSENWIHTQLKHLKGVESIVFTNETENIELVDWYPEIYSRSERLPLGIRQADSLAMWAIGYYPSFYLKAKKQNADLIHAHFGPMGYLCSGLARRLDIPLVTTFYGYDASMLLKQKPRWKENYVKLFNCGTSFLVEGPAMRQKLVSLGCPPEKIIIHHLGIETDKYEPRLEYSSQKQIKVLMVGRFVEKKGFIYGLKAFHRFKESGGAGKLTIVGDSSDEPSSKQIKKELLDYIEEHQLGDSVTFTGLIPLEELQREYYLHDVFLAPSVQAQSGDNEGGAPVTTIEASATGMPVIGSRHCDIPEVVKDEETGLIVDEKDVDALTEHLLTISRHSDLRETFGRAGAKHIKENYDAAEQGQRLAKIYRDCLE